jgi:hypothetical protein
MISFSFFLFAFIESQIAQRAEVIVQKTQNKQWKKTKPEKAKFIKRLSCGFGIIFGVKKMSTTASIIYKT